jgi:2-dehydropantoate 2-reductase
VARIAQTMPTQRSSMAQDLARGRRTEADHINGHVAARGAALGVAAPVNQALHALVKVLEQRPSNAQAAAA